MVFRDPALAYSMVALGAVLPDGLDVVTGGVGPGHSIVVGGLFLGLVMLGTRGKRRVRRRLLGLPLGFLLHLVLDGAWLAGPERLWWPLGGWGSAGDIPLLNRPLWLIAAMELGGFVLGVLAFRAIGSARSRRRTLEHRPGGDPTGTGDATWPK